MSALLARLGLTESRVVSLSVLGRGNRRHVYAAWWGVGCEQKRKVSWWKKSYDGGLGSNEFGLGTPQEQANEEREAHRKTSEFVRDKGWGLRNDGQEDRDPRSENKTQNLVRQNTGEDELSWSQNSEDAYWDAASQAVTEDDHASKQDSRKPAWGGVGDEVRVFERSSALSARVEASDESGLGWSQQSEDAFWDHSSRSSVQSSGSQVDGSPSRSSQSGAEEPQVPQAQPLPDLDYETWLPIAIEENDQDKVARCMYAARDRVDFEFIRSISEAVFTDILNVLSPRRNVRELSNAYMEISEHMAKQIGVMQVDRLMLDHGKVLHQVAVMRSRSGHRLTDAQYLILLKSAVDLGSSALTKWLWRDMQVDGVLPDLDMYNAYLASFIWAGHNNSTARHRERVINFNMTQRKGKRKDMPFQNYHIGVPGGIREKSMEILNAMLKDGISASEETYCSLITAAAREGEMDTVQSILRTVWDIDVKHVMRLNSGDAAVPKPKALPRDSKQYPTTKLLWTIAHAWGINNKIPTALRLVDYVSREYDVAIDENVWAVLFEWTFVLASRRTGTNARDDDRRIGQLPKVAVESLFDTMTRAPYFVKPTMGMYNRLIKSLSVRGMADAVSFRMAQGNALHETAKIARREGWSLLKQCLLYQERGQEHSSPEVARRQWENALVVCARNRLWMKRWVRLFLKSLTTWQRRRTGHENIRTHDFTLNHVSRLLLDWHKYAGAHVKYELPTGILEIQLQSEEDMLRVALWRERVWRDRAATMEKTNLLAGDGLLVPPADATTGKGKSMRDAATTTNRLRRARRAGVVTEEDETLGAPLIRRIES